MSKLIAEADKLLEKGKIPEALEKLKAAQKAEPLNQLVATKLANAYVDNGETDKAVKVFVALADRLSEAGKAQVAIAIYKQALELNPADVTLKVKFAVECEAAGKLSDAQNNASFALKHYLSRKKYFDAANLMPMLVRIQGKDEKLKETWIEILQLSQADQKLIHLLVALCGPPGLVSQEFSVGGEPTALSPALYDSLKRIVPFFPRDPKLAYALAWSAHRRGNMKDFYFYLRECLRRDPDFCLALLLFARTLAEKQKLNESLFVYKHLRERVMADKSVDMVTLNRLIDGFVEKNGWINFAEGEVLDANAFRDAIAQMAGGGASASAAPASAPAASSAPPPSPAAVTPPPIPPAAPSAATAEFNPMDLFAAPPVAPSVPAAAAPPVPSPVAAPTEPLDLFAAPLPSAEAAAQPAAPDLAAPPLAPPSGADLVEKGSPASLAAEGAEIEASAGIELGADSGSEMEVEHTSATRIFKAAKATGAETAAKPQAPAAAAPPETAITEEAALAPEEKSSSAKVTFSPFESSAPKVVEGENLKPVLEAGEKTQMFSPMELLGASDRKQSGNAEVKTKVTLDRPEDLAEVLSPRGDLPVFAPKTAAAEPMEEERITGAATEIFSPMEAVDAGVASRRPWGGGAQPPATPENIPPVLEADAAPGGNEPAADEPPAFAMPSPPAERPPAPPAPKGFMPIPEQSVVSADGAPEAGDGIDLGDDLLHEPTRILVVKAPAEPTVNLARELAEDLKGASSADADLLLRKSERYIAKRNYYMARKILRHALAIGGDEARIKNRLRDIRKLEFPDGLYNAISSDDGVKEASDEILDRLEKEFDLKPEEGEEAADLVSNIDFQLENIFRETDPRTILDFGVALHEMGLFRQAETVFSRLVDEFPETSFDAYYLAAISKFARKDYAGAASILKTLSADGGKTDLEKIQVYYVLGELFEKMHRLDSSKEFFRKVAELDANYRNIRHKLED